MNHAQYLRLCPLSSRHVRRERTVKEIALCSSFLDKHQYLQAGPCEIHFMFFQNSGFFSPVFVYCIVFHMYFTATLDFFCTCFHISSQDYATSSFGNGSALYFGITDTFFDDFADILATTSTFLIFLTHFHPPGKCSPQIKVPLSPENKFFVK